MLAAALLSKAHKGRKPGIIEVKDPWFTALENGTKTVEGKKGNQRWRDEIASGFVLIKKTGEPSVSFMMSVVGVRPGDFAKQNLSTRRCGRCWRGRAYETCCRGSPT